MTWGNFWTFSCWRCRNALASLPLNSRLKKPPKTAVHRRWSFVILNSLKTHVSLQSYRHLQADAVFFSWSLQVELSFRCGLRAALCCCFHILFRNLFVFTIMWSFLFTIRKNGLVSSHILRLINISASSQLFVWVGGSKRVLSGSFSGALFGAVLASQRQICCYRRHAADEHVWLDGFKVVTSN